METAVNPTKIATKWAIINVLAAIIFTYAFEFLKLDQTSPLKYLSYVPFIVFLFLTQKEYKDQLGGYMTFGQGFSAGFRYSIFTGLVLAVFIYLYLAVLSPDVFEKSLVDAQAQLEAKNMSSDQIDKAMEITKKYGPIFGAFFSAVAYTILGAIISLIGASIFKKERSLYDIEQNNALSDNYNDPTV